LNGGWRTNAETSKAMYPMTIWGRLAVERRPHMSSRIRRNRKQIVVFLCVKTSLL
jgi:hypothetical protein